ncbi:MAG: hypothetical protein M5U26_12545 [Planctomycetota bacterium]|nr:hypothetical protein [Planctomycetota bacterium]
MSNVAQVPEANPGNKADVGRPTTPTLDQLPTLAHEWQELAVEAERLIWRRVRKAAEIREVWETAKAPNPSSNYEVPPFSRLIKQYFDDCSRPTFYDDLDAWRGYLLVGELAKDPPMDSRTAFMRLFRALRRGLERAEAELPPDEIEAKKDEMRTTISNLARSVASGELEGGAVTAQARKAVDALLGKSDAKSKDGTALNEGAVTCNEPPDIRPYPDYAPKDFLRLLEDYYDHPDYESWTVTLVRVELPRWTRQGPVSVFNSPKFQRVIAESTPKEGGDLFLQFTERRKSKREGTNDE